MLEEFIIGLLGVLSGAVGAYVLTKKALSHDSIMELGEEFIENMLEKAQTDAAFQQRVYVLGGLLGQGIKAGIGMGGAKGSGGKFKFTDLIMGFIGGEVQKRFGINLGGEQQPQPQQPQTSIIPSA